MFVCFNNILFNLLLNFFCNMLSWTIKLLALDDANFKVSNFESARVRQDTLNTISNGDFLVDV